MKKLFILFLSAMLSNFSFSQESMLCQGAYWTEDEAEVFMSQWAKDWTARSDWEQRAKVIREGMTIGMKLSQMPPRSPEFKPIIHSTREMDGYIVENIAIESFPGFFITGNLYRPVSSEPFQKFPGILSVHGHGNDPRFGESVQKRSAAMARLGAVVFAYDMIGYGDYKQTSQKMPNALTQQNNKYQRVID